MAKNTLFDLTGQVAVITGGGTGIGAGIAQEMSKAGAAVVVAARRKAKIDKVAADISKSGGQALAVKCDVTDDKQLEALAKTAIKEFGKLTIWVNNAGGAPDIMPLSELPRKAWDKAIALNLTALMRGCVVAGKHIKKGSIINISSMAAYGPVPGSGHYAAAKAAVNSLTETFSVELAPNIRVNGIAPAHVPTEIMMKALGLKESDLPKLAKQIGYPLGRLGTVQDMGATAVYLASEASGWVTGQIIKVAGGR